MEEPAHASSQRPISFLDLPYELRLQIYHYCVPRRRTIDASDLIADDHTFDLSEYYGDIPALGIVRHSPPTKLLQVSQQIRHEVLEVLYGDNLFKVVLHGIGEYDLKKRLSEANRQRIRHVLLVMRPMGVSYCPTFKIDAAMWNTVLPHLRSLRIVAQQPVRRDYHFNGLTVTTDMNYWINWTQWLTPNLEYIAKTLSAESTVLVDIDGEEETKALIEQCLPRGFRQTRTQTGDRIFKEDSSRWNLGIGMTAHLTAEMHSTTAQTDSGKCGGTVAETSSVYDEHAVYFLGLVKSDDI